MSRLKISENLFLEKNELIRAQKFSAQDGWQRALRSLVKKYGVVLDDPSSFAVVTSSTYNSVDILPGLAYNSSMEAIVCPVRTTIGIGSAVLGEDKWIILRRNVTNIEAGKVSISADGSLSGVGTEFTKVLRGQPNFPTKVRFPFSAKNIYEYEVVSVISDESAILSGNFILESNLDYSVIGAFTPGFIPSESNREIYEYDSFEIEVITSAVKPEISADEFILARLKYTSDNENFSIVDLRGENVFSNESAQTSEDLGRNLLVSLLAVRRVGGTAYGDRFARLEFLIEYAYKIISFDYASSGGDYTLTISDGACNALNISPSEIPDGIFNDFIVLNRDNMKSVKIKNQIANTLTIKNDSMASQLLSENSDLIIVPDFTHLEVIIKVESNVINPEIPFTKENGTADGRLRMAIDLEYPDGETTDLNGAVTVELKYRMFSPGYRGYPFEFNTATYHDYLDDMDKTVGNGKMIIDISDVPEKEPRNYS